MLKLTSKVDISDISGAIRSFQDEVRKAVEQVGKEAVNYAKANGNYHDVTGRLRNSNKAEVAEDGSLKLYNDAPYAADIEARGQEVISGAALFAESRLKEIFE